MNTNHPDRPWLQADFFENQRNFPRENLLPYAGQYIAWRWDGKRIVASDPDRRTLDQKLRASGIDPGRVVHDYVDAPGVSFLG